MTSRWPRSLVLTLAAGLLGALFNQFSLRVVDGIALRFDGVCSLAIALAFGWAPGVGAAVIGTIPLTVATQSAAATALAAGEVLAVSLVVSRGFAPMSGAMVYWLALAAVEYSGITGVPPGFVSVLIATRLLNGVLAIVLAELAAPVLARVPWYRRGDDSGKTLRVRFLSALVPVATIPAIVLTFVLGYMMLRNVEDSARLQLAERADVVAQRLRDEMTRASVVASELAAELSGPAWRNLSAGALGDSLIHYHRIEAGFLTMLVADADGTILAGSSRIGGAAPRQVASGQNVSDRPYFLEPMRTQRPFRSEVFRGRGFGQDPIVAVSAPVLDATGRPVGVVEGSLDLRNLGTGLLPLVPETGTTLLIVDEQQRVIATAGPDDLPVLQNLGDSRWMRATAGKSFSEFVDTTTETAGRQGRFLAVKRRVADLAWDVHLKRSARAIQEPLDRIYVFAAIFVVLSILLTMPLTRRLSERMTEPLEQLVAAVSSTNELNTYPGPVLRDDAPPELRQLDRTFVELLQRVRGSHARLVATLHTLDARVQERTADLAEATARATQASHAKSEFLAAMSHELRTPLSSIIGFAEALEDGIYGTLGPAQRKSVATIRESAAHLLGLINSILDLSKIEAGRQDTVLESVSIDRALRKVFDVVADSVRRSALVLRVNQQDPHLRITADQRHVHQVLLNLVGNAIKFSRRGGTVDVTVSVAEAPYVRIAVADQGIGVPADRQASLFQPFTQIDSALSRQFQGTGLGLALVKRLVELNGGRVGFTSRENEGSCFWFELPAAHRPASTETQPS